LDEIILLKLGEMVLKGLNRHEFEARLLNNIRDRLKTLGRFQLSIRQSTVYVEPLDTDIDMDEAFRRMGYIFGPVSISRARACPKEIDAIAETAKEYLRGQLLEAKTFKVESNVPIRAFHDVHPDFPIRGRRAPRRLRHLGVDVHGPELTVHVEIREKAALCARRRRARRGRTAPRQRRSGRDLLSGGIDSPVSSFLMAKRGLALIPVHFFSYPYTSPEAKEKVVSWPG
jgi:thiamine biosynthesis protein ThiI